MSTETQIRDAYLDIRKTNHSIPDDVLDLMYHSAAKECKHAGLELNYQARPFGLNAILEAPFGRIEARINMYHTGMIEAEVRVVLLNETFAVLHRMNGVRREALENVQKSQAEAIRRFLTQQWTAL